MKTVVLPLPATPIMTTTTTSVRTALYFATISARMRFAPGRILAAAVT